MLQITEQSGNGGIELLLVGRLDAGEANTLQNSILSAFQKDLHLILNFEKIDFLSPAVLKALLIGQKTAAVKGGSMRLVHVQPQVKKVIQSTAFTNILQLED